MKIGFDTVMYLNKIKLYKLGNQKPHSVDITTTCYNISNTLSSTISIDNES